MITQRNTNIQFVSNKNLNTYLNNFFTNNVVGTYQIFYCSNFVKCSNSTICK